MGSAFHDSDLLPEEMFSCCYLNIRVHIYFSGAGGIDTLGRGEASHVSEATTSDIVNGLAP